MKAAGTRERHMERCRYNPSDPKKAVRKTRETRGVTQTFKRKGDKVISASGIVHTMTHDSWF